MLNTVFLASFGLQFIPRTKDRDPITENLLPEIKPGKRLSTLKTWI